MRVNQAHNTLYNSLNQAMLERRDVVVVASVSAIYGLGGLLVPFIGIKVIDLLLTVCGLV